MILKDGGVETAKTLLAGDVVQSGLTRLWELHLLPLSVEALVCQKRFRELFTEREVNEADRRLKQYHYANPEP